MSAARSLTLAGGRLASLSWGPENAPTWLALHGWLDNAASFSRLAPVLVERLGIRIVALDFSGHGHSAHREGDYALWDYCHDLLDAADALGLERVDRKSTRLNSSHVAISYAVFCLKKKQQT